MNTTVARLRSIIDTLQKIVDVAENEKAIGINTSCSTSGLRNFICLDSDGYFDLDEDVHSLIIKDDED